MILIIGCLLPSILCDEWIGRQWIHLGHAGCDRRSGEVYRSESSGKASNLAACQKSCQDDHGCKSITFFNLTKHCSHFSTECLVTKEAAHKDVISMRLTDRQWIFLKNS